MSTLAAQILGDRFAALAREGAARFAAMARSPLVIDEGQYACAILDDRGRLIAQDQGEPSQLAAVQAAVAHTLDAFAYDLADGDVILTGDPHAGGTWAGVLCLMVPVFAGGEMVAVAAIRFAVADLAGDVPGPFQPGAHEIWQEALRVTPVKLVRGGAPQRDVRAYVCRNARAPHLIEADLTAAEVNARHVAGRLAALVTAHGGAAVAQAAQARIAYSAARARAVLDALPGGEGASGPVQVRCADGVVDLAGTGAQDAGAANLTAVAAKGVVLVQLLGEVIEDAGVSQGLLDAVRVDAPADCCVAARAPAALSMGWRLVAPHLSAALAQATGTPPAIWPPAPLVMLFPEIGRHAVSQPLALSPGFVATEGGAGSDAASGRRRIVSVEETEFAGLMVIDRREIADGGIEVACRLRAEGIEGIVVPGGPDPVLEGAASRPRSNVLRLPAGTRIALSYPMQEAAS